MAAETVNCKYCNAPGAHPGTKKCIGDGEACSLRCDLRDAKARIAELEGQVGRIRDLADSLRPNPTGRFLAEQLDRTLEGR